MTKKVCYAASSGGHLEEISMLKELVKEGDFVLTEKSPYENVDWCGEVRHVRQINRKEITFIPKFVWLLIVSLVILLRESPEIIVSTGALATFPICFWGKLFGKKVVYIESFARVDNPSMTGKLMYRIADLFIVQWEEMMAVYPGAVLGGAIF